MNLFFSFQASWKLEKKHLLALSSPHLPPVCVFVCVCKISCVTTKTKLHDTMLHGLQKYRKNNLTLVF